MAILFHFQDGNLIHFDERKISFCALTRCFEIARDSRDSRSPRRPIDPNWCDHPPIWMITWDKLWRFHPTLVLLPPGTSIWIGPPDFCFRLSYLDTNDAWRFSLRFCWIVVQVIVKRRWGACSNRCLRESPRPVPGSASQPEKVCLFFSAPFVQQLLTCKNSVLQLWAPFPVWYSLFFRFTSLRWALFRSSCCICSRFVAGVGFHIVWVDGVGCRCAWLYSSLSPVWRCGIAWAFFDGLRWREGFGRAGCQVPCVVYIAYFVFAAASKGRVACFACLLCHLYRLVVPPTPPLETVEQACWVALGCVLCL